jgi:hypothetical protein
MGSWLDLKSLDIAGYVVSDIIGLIVFFWLMPNIALAVIVSIFVSFHLFLAWLVITAEHETGFSLPVVSTLFTHLACIVIVYFCSTLVIVLSGAALFLPIYLLIILRPIRYILAICIPGIAVFERFWLFSGKVTKKEVLPVTAPIKAIVAEATADDHAKWLRFVAQQKRPFPRPGTTLQSEYERWMVARTKSRLTVS